MKSFIITKAHAVSQPIPDPNGNTFRMKVEGTDTMQVSDGYHTMDELYDRRTTLFIALCRVLKYDYQIGNGEIYRTVWRSKLHSDGSLIDGWFILGIKKLQGEQITYHIPLDRWEETSFADTLNRAPKWDGHAPEDVLQRLKELETTC